MKTQATLQAWLTHARETLRLSRQARTAADYDKIYPRDAEGIRLWEACLADGWTHEDGERALRRDGEA